MEKTKKKHTKDLGKTIFIWVLFTALIVYTLSMVAVLGWGVLTSLKSKNDFQYNDNLLGLPTLSGKFSSRNELLHLANYKAFFEAFRITNDNHSESFDILFGTKQKITTVDVGFAGMLLNSVVYALGNGLVQVTVLSVMGYMCAKYDYKFSRLLYIVIVVTMALPIIGAYPSEITLLRNLNLYDNWVGNFVQKFTFTGMYFLVFYEYFKGMPDTYKDAAEIDGASQWTVMTRIYLPMAIKMVGSVLLIRFVFYWNDYSAIRMYMRTHPTLSYGIFWNTIANPMKGGLPVQVAACMTLALPILVVFICLQEKIMGSMSLGGIKE